jgi:catechol 2,3-dioxygenase-like lactoylglutathione lyase family enzyme
MLHHVELYVTDLERSCAFWTPFMAFLGYEAEGWSGGMNYVRGDDETYFCLLPAPTEHLAAGYHRKRVGLNHLAFRGTSRDQVDLVAQWLKDNGHTLLYEDRHPFAGGPDYYAVFCEDPDRFKLEVVAPSAAST